MVSFVLLVQLAAQQLPPIQLFPDIAPGEIPGRIGPESGSDKVHNVSVPTLTPYLSKAADAAVIIAPGGAYHFLSWDLEGTSIAEWLNSIGIHAFILKYRVPGRPWLPFGQAPFMDAQRAVGVVRGKAAALGINISKGVGFIGFSAGGHLTGRLSAVAGGAPYARAYRKIDAADNASCRPDFSLMVYPWCLTGDVGNCTQDANHTINVPVSSANPPAFLAQAEDDPVHIDNSISYYLALKQRGAPPSELHAYPRGGHGYGRTKCAGLEVCSWPDRAATFLRTLGAAAPPPPPTSVEVAAAAAFSSTKTTATTSLGLAAQVTSPPPEELDVLLRRRSQSPGAPRVA